VDEYVHAGASGTGVFYDLVDILFVFAEDVKGQRFAHPVHHINRRFYCLIVDVWPKGAANFFFNDIRIL
jgi:hypothetical protein